MRWPPFATATLQVLLMRKRACRQTWKTQGSDNRGRAHAQATHLLWKGKEGQSVVERCSPIQAQCFKVANASSAAVKNLTNPKMTNHALRDEPHDNNISTHKVQTNLQVEGYLGKRDHAPTAVDRRIMQPVQARRARGMNSTPARRAPPHTCRMMHQQDVCKTSQDAARQKGDAPGSGGSANGIQATQSGGELGRRRCQGGGGPPHLACGAQDETSRQPRCRQQLQQHAGAEDSSWAPETQETRWRFCNLWTPFARWGI